MSRIPGHVVAGTGSPFPAGVFLGRLADVKDTYSEDGKSLDFAMQFQDITPIEGPQVGARPFTQRITIITNELSVVDVQEFNDEVPFRLRDAATLISQLAIALGYQMTVNADKSIEFNMEEFLENLQSGIYKDRVLGFEVRQRPGKKGTPNASRVFSNITRIFNPEAQAAPVAAEVTEEAPAETPAGNGATTLRSLRSRK